MPGEIFHQSLPYKLILASASPRRKELLAAAGIECEVWPSTVKEWQGEQESAEEFVRRIAEEKANDVLSRLSLDSPRAVLGADTVVLADGRTLGKPSSADDAARMLRLLSGNAHRVLTGVCLLYSGAADRSRPEARWQDTRVASTTVQFLPLSDQEIIEYVATGEPFDKAGAYAIQGRASKFVESIEGCYFNVVGLPVSLVYQMLQRLNAALRDTGK